jgi:beta-N-acetylhexosaminidase
MIEQTGQIIMTGISGTKLQEKEAQFIEQENVGGVILFSRNYENPTQLCGLVNSIQDLRQFAPLFIAVDHEGGRVIRFKTGFTQFPAMGEISKKISPRECFDIYQVMARQLLSCGVNLNFAPVGDILTNPENKVIGDRSFGTTSEEVCHFIAAAIRGLQSNGVMACVKHFPGHGDTVADSHEELPVVKATMNELRSREFWPFIKASKSRVEFIMMAHLLVDCIDSKLPTSLSPNAYNIIRRDLRCRQLIITDSMNMKAITANYGIEEAAVMAVSAGADILLYENTVDALKALTSIREGIKSRRLRKSDIDEKCRHIAEVKKRYLSNYMAVPVTRISKPFNPADGQGLLAFLTKIIENSANSAPTVTDSGDKSPGSTET